MNFDKYLKTYLDVAVDSLEVNIAVNHLEYTIRNKRTIYGCGNGGSGYSVSHLVQDLVKQCGANAYSLNDNWGLITAIANDIDYSMVFVEQLKPVSNSYTLLAVSCSGNSPNVLQAVEHASSTGNYVIGFTGGDGGLLRSQGLCNLIVSPKTTDIFIAESLHSAIFHYIISQLKERIKA